MKRIIKKVAVLGSGTMGAQIACHFANTGLEVLLLDIRPDKLTEAEKEKGLSLEDPAVRNRIVDDNLEKAVRSDPSPLFKKEFSTRIQTGNFEDHFERIAGADWVVEAVIEKADIKRSLFERVEKHRRKGSLITTNTSGIPIHSLIEGRSADFQQHFCGTHFFNPPRYLELLEIIPSEKTKEEVIRFLENYGEVYLGKTTVVCKDTPAFIGNRIGIYAQMLTMELMEEIGLTISEVDALTGQLVGRPKTATFRTADLVGIDILADVAQGVYEHCPDDEERAVFKIPDFMDKMVQRGWLGQKAESGFYKKIKDQKGESVILALDTNKMEYRKEAKPKFPIQEAVKKQDNTKKKIQSFEEGELSTLNFFKRIYLKIVGDDDDKAIRFFREFYYRLFAYASHRVPEITDHFYKIDQTIKAGFNWEYGPFEIWDILGMEETLEKMEEAGHHPADWIYDMAHKGATAFYRTERGGRLFYDRLQEDVGYLPVPRSESLISLDNYREEYTVWQNDSCNLIDLGDGVLNIEFTSKRNTIDQEVMVGINKAIDLTEQEDGYRALVIANEGRHFSFGANLAMIGINAYKGNLDTVEAAVEQFQNVTNRLRYCDVPVVVAPHGRTLGGGAELCLYADAVQAAAETYMGLVEFGVGLVPGGGGTVEFVRRAAGEFVDSDPRTPHLQHRIMTIAQAEVSTSAHEAFDLGYLREGLDLITMNKNRLITDAKHRALDLAEQSYVAPHPMKVKVLGKNALSFFYTGINNQYRANYITEYDQEIARKLAYVMCGGDLSEQTEVSHHYLIRLERAAFMELVQNKKTLKRIEHMLKEGKPLRN
jgi:3-hydroxyacyl-CoA dehydrogenase